MKPVNMKGICRFRFSEHHLYQYFINPEKFCFQVQPTSPIASAEVTDYPDTMMTMEKGNEHASLEVPAEDSARDGSHHLRIESPLDDVDEKEHSDGQNHCHGFGQTEQCSDEVRLTEHGEDQAKCTAEPEKVTEPISSQSIPPNGALNVGEEHADVETDDFCSLLPDSSEWPQYRSSTSMSDNISDTREKKVHQRYFSSELWRIT